MDAPEIVLPPCSVRRLARCSPSLKNPLRALEFRTLHVSWATNAYGSLLWVILGLHGTLVAIELAEVAGMTIIMHGEDPEPKHFTDAADIAFYWYFLVGSWLPLYAMVWLLPRWA